MSLDKWKEVDSFNEKVEWQRELAINLWDVCGDIATNLGKAGERQERWGSDDSDFAQFGILFVTEYQWVYKDAKLKFHREKKDTMYDSRRYIQNDRIRVSLTDSQTEVLDISKYDDSASGATAGSFVFNILRPGSWIEDVKPLFSRIEQRRAELESRQRQQDQERFGRID